MDAGNMGPVEAGPSHSVLQNGLGGNLVILLDQSIPGPMESPNVNLVVEGMRHNADQGEDFLHSFSAVEMLEVHTTDQFVGN